MVKDKLNDFLGANQDFDEAVKLDPTNVTYLHNRANAGLALRDFQQVEAVAGKLIELNAKDAEAFNLRGIAYDHRKDYAAAIKDYTQAIELARNNAVYYINRGDSWFQMNDDAKARPTRPRCWNSTRKASVPPICAMRCAIGRKVIPSPSRVNPSRPRPMAIISVGCCGSKTARSTVLADFNKAIELDPKLAGAYAERGFNAWNYNHGDHGKADLDRAIELDPKLSKAYYYRGLLSKLPRRITPRQSPTTTRPSSSIPRMPRP